MAIVKSKPTSPGRRGLISVKSDLTEISPLLPGEVGLDLMIAISLCPQTVFQNLYL